MKSYILPLILIFVTKSLFVSAQISVNKNSGCAPLTGVQFTSLVNGDWDFGNGTSASGTDNGSAIYSAPGTYFVTFNDGSNEFRDTITVYGNPNPDFSVVGSSTGCAPFPVTFNDASSSGGSSSIVDWEWSFGNGAASSDPNPTYTYPGVGNYTVSLIVTDDNGCDSTAVKTDLITVSDPPTASFIPSPMSSCTAPLVVTLTNNSTNSTGGTSDLTYEWDFGDSQTSSSANPGTHTYNSEGNFPITLTVSENGGCSRFQTTNINIGSPEAIINAADTVCIGENVQYFNNSNGGTSYEWIFDDGGTSTSENPTHAFISSGNHLVTLIAKDAGCNDTTTKSVYVQDPQITLTGNPSYKCEEPFCVQFSATGNEIENWDYLFYGGQTSTEQNPEHCYQHIGGDEYTVYYYGGYVYETVVTGTSEYGCEATATFRDTVFPISANFAPNITQGCAPLTVVFQDSSSSGSNITSYQYDFNDGSTANTDSASHTFNAAGEYDVRLIIENENGCRDTSFAIQIQVGDSIDVDLQVSPSTVCIGDTVVITDATGDPRIDDYHFSTDENRGSESCPGDSIQQWSYFNETGQHDITFYANYNGCISTELFSNAITVNGPSSSFIWSGDCSSPTNINFTATVSDVDSIYWYFGDGDTLSSDDLSDTTVTHSYDTSGDYTVVLISTNNSTGCDNDTNTMVVKVRMLKAIIDVDSIHCLNYLTASGENSIDVEGDCNNSYRWDLGDGTTMHLSDDPSWTGNHLGHPTDTGTYTIRLMVYDVNGCRDTAEADVVITDLYAGFSTDTTTGCIPLTINFTDTSWSATNIQNWTWSFGDGNFGNGSTTSNTYTDNTTLNYTVTLTVIDSLGCTDSENIIISPIIPDSNFTVNDQRICVGEEVTFTVSNQNSMSNAVWNFGGQGSSSELNPTFQFDASGDYTIHVQLTDTNGCNSERTRTEYVMVDDYPTAGFNTSVDSIGIICHPANITFTDTSVVTFGTTSFGSRTWDLGVGSPILPTEEVTWNYNEPGTYVITLIEETWNGCKDTIVDSINIVGPLADFSVSESIICIGDEITFNITDSSDIFAYLWGFGDATGTDTTYLSEVSSAEVTNRYTSVPDGGSTVVQLVVWSEAFACAYAVDKTVNLHNIEAKFGFEDSTVCLDVEVVFADSSLANSTTLYSWDVNGDGVFETFPSSNNIPDASYNSPGSYPVTLILDDPTSGCIDTAVKQLLIHSLPTISATDGETCSGDTALIIASGGDSYVWTGFETIVDINTDSAYAFPSETTTYTVTGTDTNNCVSTATAVVNIVREKEFIRVDTCIIIGDSVTIGFDYGEGFTYDWSEGPTDFLECLTCPVQTIHITEEVDSILFEVLYSDSLGCFPKINEYNICVEDKYTVDVPSAFTPDASGYNDVVKVNGHGIKELIYFRIYNRWGELVFETNELSQGWDGIYKGNTQGVETFVYQAKVKFYNDKFGEKGGDITLIR